MKASPLERIDLNLLRLFDVLMQEQHVTRTAERLHLSQSTISHALARLRETVDDPLFITSRRQMIPTERAKSLAIAVRSALTLLEHELRKAEGFDPSTAERTFRVAAPGSIEYGLIPRLVERLHEIAPRCRLEVCELFEKSYQNELERSELDLLFTFAGVEQLSTKLNCEPWFSNDLVCLSPLGSGLPEQLTPEHLVNWPHIHTSSWGHSQATVDRWLGEHGLQRQIGVRVPTFLAVASLMATGRYLVVLPEMMGRHLCQQNRLQQHRLLPQIPNDYLLVSHPLTQNDPAINWFKGELHQLVQNVQGLTPLKVNSPMP